MTDTTPDEPTPIELPERVALDPYSAAVLAVMESLNEQIPADASVVIDPEAITRAALEAASGDMIPRVPKWDGEQRTIGGKRPAGAMRSEAEVAVNGPTDTGDVAFTVTATDTEGHEIVDTFTAPARDVSAWLLAALGAAQAAERVHVDTFSDYEG